MQNNIYVTNIIKGKHYSFQKIIFLLNSVKFEYLKS